MERDVPTEPVGPDVGLHVPAQRAQLSRTRGGLLAAIALGGGLGGLARYGVSLALPAFWSTFAINVLGSFFLGVLMVIVTEVRRAHPLVRPFLGVGVLGGFTTFSTSALEFHQLLGSPWAPVYLVSTAVAAVVAAASGVVLTRPVCR
jgi:CrcB protein